MHELTAERAALANGRDGDRFHLIIEDGDVANYDSPHFFTVRLDSELLQKQFHEFIRYSIRKRTIPMSA